MNGEKSYLSNKMALSICIPTYNRGVYLKELLCSIRQQYKDNVQVVIADNASNDNTWSVICEFKRVVPNVKYYRHPYNVGPDRNYLKVVELADGEYCWLMGSDDVLSPNALSKVLCEIQLGRDIYLGNRVVTDINLNPIKHEKWLRETPSSKDFFLTGSDALVDYFSRANSIGAAFSYLSSIVVRRELWCSVDLDPCYIGTGYPHAAILLSIIARGASLRYIYDSIVLCRLGNDSFLSEGYAKRFMLDIDGYLMLSKLVPETSRPSFYTMMRRTRTWLRVVKVRMVMGESEWLKLEKKLTYYGWNPLSLKIAKNLKFARRAGLLFDRIRFHFLSLMARTRMKLR